MLEDLLLDLLRIPSVTGEEARIADFVAEHAARSGAPVRRIGNSVVAGDPRAGWPTVLLVAHLDTVPPAEGDGEPHRDGDRIVGRGASDMKAGLAVAMDVFGDPHLVRRGTNLVLVGYAREEGPAEENELRAVLDQVDGLTDAQFAIVLEPTDLEVQLGCMGGLHARVVFSGRAAHSARPWQGRNALTAAGALLTELHERQPADVDVDGLTFREVLVPTQAWTANAANVVPDRFTVNLNYRFAPDKTVAEAEQVLARVVGDRAELVVTDRVPPGRPRRDSGWVDAFIVAANAPVTPKQAWTDVARFSEVGMPALNYGPGLTSQAHQAGEYVPAANLSRARDTIALLLDPPPG
jgi:succinyl-diaminopimelate desuccinylase